MRAADRPALTLWSVLHRIDDPVAGVLPTGLILSLLVAGILMLTGWLGGELSYRYRVGVTDDMPGHGATPGRTNYAGFQR